MPLDEARKLRNIYHILDKEYDFDGSIPQEKVIEILRMFDANPTAHDERQLLAELDVNNDLFVSFREMCSYFAVKGWVTAVESKEHKILKLRSFLEIFDVNKDGKWVPAPANMCTLRFIETILWNLSVVCINIGVLIFSLP